MGSNIIKKKNPQCEVSQSCPTLCDPMDCSLPGSSVYGVFQARVLEWVDHFLLQGIFPTQGSNPGLLNYRKTLYCLSHQGSQLRSSLVANFLCWVLVYDAIIELGSLLALVMMGPK